MIALNWLQHNNAERHQAFKQYFLAIVVAFLLQSSSIHTYATHLSLLGTPHRDFYAFTEKLKLFLKFMRVGDFITILLLLHTTPI